MSGHPSTPEERYASIGEELLGNSDPPESTKGFGSATLKVNNKIFAMLVKGRLVVKLPRQRVDALITSGEGGRFDPGHGRLMKEWVTVEPTSEEWLPLAQEAMEFVASRR